MRGTRAIDVAGVLVFFAVLIGIGALVALPAPELRDDERPMMTFTVRPGEPVSFLLDPDTTEVKLVTIGERRPGPRLDEARPEAYTIAWTWLDGDGQPVADQILPLAAGPAMAATVGEDDGPSEILVPRSIRLRPPGEPGDVAALRVEVPAGEPAVRVRAFRSRPAPWGTSELALLAVDQRDARTLARRVGLASWHDVTRDEALALSTLRWEGMNPQRADLAEGASGTTILPAPPLPAPTRRALGARLDPGHALAWSLAGPGDVAVVAQGDLQTLSFRLVVENVGEVPLEITEATPPSWRATASARQVRWTVPGRASLHVRNDGDHDVEGMIVLVGEQAAIAEDAELVPVASFTQTDDTRRSVAPAWAELRRVAATPGAPARIDLPGTADVLRLELRAVHPRRDSAPTELGIVVETASGEVRHGVVLDLPADPYATVGWDTLPLDPALWPTEASVRFVRLPADARRVQVQVAADGDPVLVAAALPGPPRGTTTAWDAARITTELHPRDAVTTWTPLVVAGAPVALRVVRRRELLTGADAGGLRRYTTVDPVPEAGGVPGDGWLLPPAPDLPLAGLVYCGVDAGKTEALRWDAEAVAGLGGALSAVLWAPDADRHAALGGGFDVTLDGAPWLTGRFDAAVLRRTSQRAPASSLHFDGPANARLWVRVLARPDRSAPCDDPWRARRVVEVAPGQSVRYRIPAGGDDRIVVVGGVGSQTAPLAVSVIPSTRSPDVTEDWTERERVLVLEHQPGPLAVALETPWNSDAPLVADGMRLRSDVAGTVDVVLRPLGASPVRLYVVVEKRGEPVAEDVTTLKRMHR